MERDLVGVPPADSGTPGCSLSGEAVWFLSTGLNKPFFEALLAAFARETGAGRERHIVLVLDDAGRHGPKGLAVPEGIGLVYLPPYSPELQPAEHLWPLVDEPIVNRHFATLADLETVVAERCRRLEAAAIKPHTEPPRLHRRLGSLSHAARAMSFCSAW